MGHSRGKLHLLIFIFVLNNNYRIVYEKNKKTHFYFVVERKFSKFY